MMEAFQTCFQLLKNLNRFNFYKTGIIIQGMTPSQILIMKDGRSIPTSHGINRKINLRRLWDNNNNNNNTVTILIFHLPLNLIMSIVLQVIIRESLRKDNMERKPGLEDVMMKFMSKMDSTVEGLTSSISTLATNVATVKAETDQNTTSIQILERQIG